MEIIFENQDWLVINKPSGISSQAAFAGDIAVPEWWLLHHDKKIHVFSRLDKETSGVMVLAKNARAAAQAQDIQRRDESLKEYVFLSAGDSSKKHGLKWNVDTPISGKSAHTVFERLGTSGRYFLYSAKIKSGRIHQIRRHAKESLVPILGDEQYGGARFPRLCLHCKTVSWPAIKNELQAPLPLSMGSLGSFAEDPGFLAAFDRRLRFYEGVTDAFRCVHRGEMKALDCAIDFYAGWLCLWIYDESTPLSVLERMLEPYLKKLFSRYQAVGAVIKRNLKNPHSRKLVAEQKIIGEKPPNFFEVSEHGLKYRVSLTEGQHVGLFLDQRDNRLRVKKMAANRRVANLFSYTSSFSVAAAAGGASEVFSIDAAGPCLEIGRENFKLNDLESGRFIKEDVRIWLRRQIKKTRESHSDKMDIVICDPPTFSKTKAGGNFSVEKDWEYLVQACCNIGGDNADFLFCNNHREGSQNFYRKILDQNFNRILEVCAPLDFPVLYAGNAHVRMFWCGK